MSLLKKLIRDETGQGLAEYGLILALVSVAVIATLTALGDNIRNVLDDISDYLEDIEVKDTETAE
jgi:pilus assembly protein Flp/PilA